MDGVAIDLALQGAIMFRLSTDISRYVEQRRYRYVERRW
jgi:hypothetical protein